MVPLDHVYLSDEVGMANMLPARAGDGRVRLCPALSRSARKSVCAELRDSSIVLSSVNDAAAWANLVIRPTAASTATIVTAIEISNSSKTESAVVFGYCLHVPQNVFTVRLVEPHGEERLRLPSLFMTLTVN